MVAVSIMASPVGARLKSLRERRGWSQEQLALRAQVKRAWIAQVEAGHVDNPRANNLDRVARVLGVTSTYLLTGVAHPEDPEKEAVLGRFRQWSVDKLLQLERIGNIIALQDVGGGDSESNAKPQADEEGTRHPGEEH